jgi:tripartite-type tricarboxylate transporter receptor subunit TctC
MDLKSRATGLTRRLALGAAFAAALTTQVLAQAFPSRPITLIVPFAAGGPSDVIARLVGEYMGRTLGQQVVVENVAGAGGTSGARRLLAGGTNDGHTILIHHLALAASASLYDNLGYDTATAFEPIGLVNTGPMAIAAKLALEPVDARSFFAWAKAQGDKVTIAHAGIGSNAHLCSVLMSQAIGAKFTQVAYRGTGPAMNDLVGGVIDVLCDQSTTAVPQIQGGKIKAYAVTSPTRLDVLPATPTAKESGVDLEMTIWHGLYAPKGTPADALTKLNAALAAALKEPVILELQIGWHQRLPGSRAQPRGPWQALRRRNREMGSGPEGRRRRETGSQLTAQVRHALQGLWHGAIGTRSISGIAI